MSSQKGHAHLFNLQRPEQGFNGNDYASTEATDQEGK